MKKTKKAGYYRVRKYRKWYIYYHNGYQWIDNPLWDDDYWDKDKKGNPCIFPVSANPKD